MRRIVILPIIFLGLNALAQKDSIRFAASVKSYKDGVSFRWAPKFAYDYFLMNRHNIVVQKKSGDGPVETVAVLKPVPLSEWRKLLDTTNRYARLAAGCTDQLQRLYSTPEPNTFKAMENHKTAEFLYGNLLLSADLYPELAKVLGLRFDVKTLSVGEHYAYKIFAQTKGIYTDTIYIHVDFKGTDENRPAPELSFTGKEKSADLKWQGQPVYSAYFIEKYDAKAKVFRQLNKNALLTPKTQNGDRTISFTDTFVKNYMLYDYRVYGIDAFGDRSPYSNVVSAMGVDITPPPMPGPLRLKRLNDTTVRISWDKIIPESGEKSLGISYNYFSEGYYTSLTPKGLPLTDTVFIYQGSSDHRDIHFALSVYDSAGNSSFSKAFIQLPDKRPPATPRGLKAMVSKTGIVTLNWEWNLEDDFDGYLVYSAMDSLAEFSGLVNRPMMDTCFRDTLSLKMLNRKVFYRIVAVDRYFNKSKPTQIITLLRPDTLRPVSPVFKSYLCTDSSIELHWVPSSSYDVAKHFLIKTNLKTKKSLTIALNNRDTFYKDKEVTSEQYYRYSLFAEDENKNISLTGNYLELKTYKQLYKEPIKILVAKHNPDKKQIELSWSYDAKNIKSYSIYKGTSMDAVSFYTNTGNADNLFKDLKIAKGKKYYYAVKAHFNDGTMTRLSSSVEIEITE